MSATDDAGSEKHWIDGQPIAALKNGSNDTGSEKYWIDGQPIDFLIPAAATGAGQMLLMDIGG